MATEGASKTGANTGGRCTVDDAFMTMLISGQWACSPGSLMKSTSCLPKLLVSRSMSALGETIPVTLAIISPAWLSSYEIWI